MTTAHGLVAGLVLFAATFAMGCGEAYEAEAPLPLPPRAVESKPPAPAPVSSTTTTDAPLVETRESTEAIETKPGAPEIVRVTYAARDNAFKTHISHLYGAKWRILYVELKNPNDVPERVLVRGSLQGFTSSERELLVDLEPKSTKSIVINPVLDYSGFAKVSAPVPAKYSVTLSKGGEVVSTWSRAITVLPKSTVFWTKAGTTTMDKEIMDGTIGSLTTPHDQWGEVDKLLVSAATRSRHKRMVGYSLQTATSTLEEDFDNANDQLEAVYDAMKAAGHRYTALPGDFFTTERVVRYPAETLRLKQGTALEGALVFASAIESIGMDPIVIAQPTGHALVGVRLGRAGTAAAGYWRVLDLTKMATSDYESASEDGMAQQKAVTTGALSLDLKALRQNGFGPSPFPM